MVVGLMEQASPLTLELKKHEHPVVGQSSGETSPLPVTNYQNDQYYATLYAYGSAALTFLLDTGSSECWVGVNACLKT
jgi:hypothetical protein